MRSPDDARVPERDDSTPPSDSLADQALEAIVRSQQLRERSRNLRKEKGDNAKPKDKDKSS